MILGRSWVLGLKWVVIVAWGAWDGRSAATWVATFVAVSVAVSITVSVALMEWAIGVVGGVALFVDSAAASWFFTASAYGVKDLFGAAGGRGALASDGVELFTGAAIVLTVDVFAAASPGADGADEEEREES